MLNAQRKEALVTLCRDMIRVNSVTGGEKSMAEMLCTRMKEMGFDDVYTDETGSVIGKIGGSGGGKTIVLDGHIDTVDVSDPAGWTHGPFAAEEKDGRIYGRGAADMKGASAAMITAAACLAQDKRPAGDIYVTGTVLEEVAEGVSLRYILEKIKADVVIIGEATELNLNIGQRGRAEVLLTVKGKSAHSSNPEKGINAVTRMMTLLQRLETVKIPSHEVLGNGILALTDIISSPYPGASVIPERCAVTMDRRLLAGEDEETVLGGIRAVIEELKKEIPSFDAEASIAGMELNFYTGLRTGIVKFAPAWLLDRAKNGALIDAVLAALGRAGLSPRVSTYKFCTNGSASAGHLGIPTIGFGPCAEWQAHVVDEYVEIEQLFAAAKGYYELIDTLGNQ
jgi:putative selenium metabolism hydrolase